MTDNKDKVFLGEASFSQKEGSVGSNPTPPARGFHIVCSASIFIPSFAV